MKGGVAEYLAPQILYGCPDIYNITDFGRADARATAAC